MATNSPEKMLETMIRNLPEKTGKSLEEWLLVVGNSSLEKHGQVVQWLKADHGVTHGFANLIAQRHLAGRNAGANVDLVDTQYSGAKESLRPIYDAVRKLVEKFGDDVEISPKKTYVSFRRNKQFALVQPSAKDRVDIGIKLRDAKETKRLEKSGSFNAMLDHRVRIDNKKQVDEELKQWLKAAYEAA